MHSPRRIISFLLIVSAAIGVWALTSLLVSLVKSTTWLPQSSPLEKLASLIACFILAIGLLGFAAQGVMGFLFPHQSDPDAAHVKDWIAKLELNPPIAYTHAKSAFEGRLPDLETTLNALCEENRAIVENYELIVENAADQLADNEKASFFQDLMSYLKLRRPGKPPPPSIKA